LFTQGDRISLKLLSEDEQPKSLDDRLADVIAVYNKNPVDGITVQRDAADRRKIIRSQDGNALRRDATKDSILNFLQTIDDPQTWLLAHDLKVEWGKKAPEGAVSQPIAGAPVAFEALKNRLPQPCDGMNVNDLRVVISRDALDIARMSTGRRWTSCMTKGDVNYHYVPHEIEAGTLVAYLVHKDDKQIEYPLMRVLLKPFRNKQGETILVPNRVYPTKMTGNSSTQAAAA
jgi:hypothetical protein